MSSVARFGDIAQVIRGVAFDKSQVVLESGPGLTPILRAGNIQGELVVDTDLIWVPDACVLDEQRLKVGDVAIAVSSGSASLVGKSAPLTHAWNGSVGAFCAVIRPKVSIDAAYLALWLRGPEFSKWREARTRGANIQNLQLADLLDTEIVLPPRSTQAAVATSAGEQLQVAAAAARAQDLQLLDATSLWTKLLGAQFADSAPVRTSATDESASNGWSFFHLRSLARLESGHTPSRRHPEWWGGDVPWLALPDIRKLHGKVAYQTAETTNDAGLANSSARLLPVGTVCVSRTASIGFVTMLGRRMATSQDFCNWICDPERLDPEFLMYAFMASQEHLRELGSGAVHKTIYMPTIESFHIHAPGIDEQRRIARTLREQLVAAEALRARLAERQAEIERLPQRILAAAFGEA